MTMTQDEWNDCKDPLAMTKLLANSSEDGKRLLSLACDFLRNTKYEDKPHWDLLDEEMRGLVTSAEKFANGEMGVDDWKVLVAENTEEEQSCFFEDAFRKPQNFFESQWRSLDTRARLIDAINSLFSNVEKLRETCYYVSYHSIASIGNRVRLGIFDGKTADEMDAVVKDSEESQCDIIRKHFPKVPE